MLEARREIEWGTREQICHLQNIVLSKLRQVLNQEEKAI